MVRLTEFWRFRWVRQCVLRCIFGTFSSVIFELQTPCGDQKKQYNYIC